VKRGPDRLTKDPAERLAAEEAATTLDPADTLAEAGVTDGSWVVAQFATGPAASVTALSWLVAEFATGPAASVTALA